MKTQKGFTLIELIIVIVILAILAAVAIPKFVDLSAQANEAACRSNQGTAESACAIYMTNEAVNGRPAVFPVTYWNTDLYANNIVPSCPSGGSYFYDGITGTITCAGLEDHARD